MTHPDNTAPTLPPNDPSFRPGSVDDLLAGGVDPAQQNDDPLFTSRNNATITSPEGHSNQGVTQPMSKRIQVLKFLLENGPAKRAQVGEGTQVRGKDLSNALGQMSKSGLINQTDEAQPSDRVYTISDAGKAHYARNKDRAYSERGQAPKAGPQVQPAPQIPNLSQTAEQFADGLAQVLAENSELRNLLVEVRDRISRAIGDTENEQQAS